MEGLSPDFAGSTLETCYQPIVRMSDRALLSVEALARLSHPSRGLLKPDQFVHMIEDAGGGGELTGAVVVSVLADLNAGWLGGAGLDVSVAINMPLDVLLEESCLDQLTDLRRAAGREARRIRIELTESRPVDDLIGLRTAIERARAGGYEVALDDYAPSMPHCRALLDLPFSAVKFDHCMIAAAARAGPQAAFVAATIQAAHARGITVTAEGVEDAASWSRLRAQGVDAAQGFWIAGPLTAAEIEPWRQQWTAAAH